MFEPSSRHAIPDWLPHCMQMFDSAFPTGAYAHSFGMEGLVQMGQVRSGDESLKDFVETQLFPSLAQQDLPLLRLAYDAASKQDYPRLLDLDVIATASLGTQELREASRKIGRQLLILANKLLESKHMGLKQGLIDSLVHKNTITVLGALSQQLQIPVIAALSAYCTQTFMSLAQASIKLLHTGPTQAQIAIHTWNAAIADIIEESLLIEKAEIGFTSPCWDIASARHQHAPARLFIS